MQQDIEEANMIEIREPDSGIQRECKQKSARISIEKSVINMIIIVINHSSISITEERATLCLDREKRNQAV